MTASEQWLDEISGHLSRFPMCRRRILDELSDHIRASSAELQAAGLAPAAADTEAVRRLGNPRTVAAEFAHQITRERSVFLTRTIGGTAFATVALIGLVPLLAVLGLYAGPTSDTVRLTPDSWYPTLRWLLLFSIGVMPPVALATVAFTAGRVFRTAVAITGAGYLFMLTAIFKNNWPPEWASIAAWAAFTLVAGTGIARRRKHTRTLPPRLAATTVTTIVLGATLRLAATGVPIPRNAPAVAQALPELATYFLAPIALLAFLSYSDARHAAVRLHEDGERSLSAEV